MSQRQWVESDFQRDPVSDTKERELRGRVLRLCHLRIISTQSCSDPKQFLVSNSIRRTLHSTVGSKKIRDREHWTQHQGRQGKTHVSTPLDRRKKKKKKLLTRFPPSDHGSPRSPRRVSPVLSRTHSSLPSPLPFCPSCRQSTSHSSPPAL